MAPRTIPTDNEANAEPNPAPPPVEEAAAADGDGTTKAKKITWRSSEAKQIMAQDMMDGLIPVDEPIRNPERMYNTMYGDRPEFATFPYNHNVPGRIARLQATVNKMGSVARSDSEAFLRDRARNPQSTPVGYNGRLLWKGHEADARLKEDIAAGKHLELLPSELCATYAGYDAFGAERLGKRINQLVEKAKPYGAKKGQKNRKLPRGVPEKSRKDTHEGYNNVY